MAEQVQRLTIEIETGEPIHGRLLDGLGSAHAFHGWLELSAALEDAREQGGDDTPTASERVQGEKS